MGDRNLSDLEPNMQRKMKATIDESKQVGYTVLMTDGYRSFQDQADEFAKGRTQDVVDKLLAGTGVSAIAHPEMGKVTNALPGQSYHNVRRGADYTVIIDGRAQYPKDVLKIVADIAKKHGLEWGGDWSGNLGDDDHLQYAICDFCNERHTPTQFREDGSCKLSPPAQGVA